MRYILAWGLLLGWGLLWTGCEQVEDSEPRSNEPVIIRPLAGGEAVVLKCDTEVSEKIRKWITEARVVQVFDDPSTSLPYGYVHVGSDSYMITTIATHKLRITQDGQLKVLAHQGFPLILNLMQVLEEHGDTEAEEVIRATQRIREFGDDG